MYSEGGGLGRTKCCWLKDTRDCTAIDKRALLREVFATIVTKRQ